MQAVAVNKAKLLESAPIKGLQIQGPANSSLLSVHENIGGHNYTVTYTLQLQNVNIFNLQSTTIHDEA